MSRGGAVAVACAAAVLTCLFLAGASAHEVEDRQPIVHAIEPALEGVTIQVVTTLAEQFVVSNPTDVPLDAIGEDGSAFLRIGAGGTEANVGNAGWYRSLSPEPIPVPPTVTPGAPPEWRRVSPESSWGWFDERLHEDPWSVRFRYGDRDVVVRGGHRGRVVGRFEYEVRPDRVDGVTLGVLDGRVPAIATTVKTGVSLLVRGDDGEPFARVGGDGAEVNEASPTWALTAASRREPVDGPQDSAASPRWRRVGTSPQLFWLERRAAGRVGETSKWVLDIEVDARPFRIQGVTRWRSAPPPERAGPGRGWVGPALLVGGALAVAAVWINTRVRRRSRRE